MRVHVEGVAVDLAPSDFVGAGGEASVYARGTVAYKIWADPAMAPPPEKLAELAAISHPWVVVPEAVVRDAAAAVVGCTMRFLPDMHPLCRLFARPFRAANGFDPGAALALAERLHEALVAVHRAGVVVVDLNEMNVLTDLARPFLIDATSWQTRSFPATAISDAVRDRHARGWSPASDWFSLAVLSFQLFTGVHPYRGTHPTLRSLDDRMRANVSVLHPDVRVPPSALPFDAIPAAWRGWFRAVLDEGVRRPPPTGAAASAWLSVDSPASALEAVRVLEQRGVRRYVERLGARVALGDGVWVDGRRTTDLRTDEVAFSPANRPVLARREGDRLVLTSAVGAELPLALAADGLTTADGALVVLRGDTLCEILLLDVGARVVASPVRRANVLPRATRLFEGVAVQDLLGAAWVLLLRPGACRPVRVAELDGWRVLHAKHERGVLALIAERGGRFDRLVLRFDGARYDLRRDADVGPGGVDLVVLDSGVAVLAAEGAVELFAARPDSPARRRVDDPMLSGGRLIRLGAALGVLRDDGVWRVRLR